MLSDDWSYEILQDMGPLSHTMVLDERYVITSPGFWVGMTYRIRPTKLSLRSNKSNFKSLSVGYIQIFTWKISTGFSSKMTRFLLPDLAFRAQNQPLNIVRSLHPPRNYSLQSTSIKSSLAEVLSRRWDVSGMLVTDIRMPPKRFSIQKSPIGEGKWISCIEFPSSQMLDLVLFLREFFANSFVGAYCTFCYISRKTFSSLDPRILSAWKFARYRETTTYYMWGKLSCALPKPWCIDLRAWTWHRPPGYQARKHSCSISKPTPDKTIRLRPVERNLWIENFLRDLYIRCAWNPYYLPGYMLYRSLWHLAFPTFRKGEAGLGWCRKIVDQLHCWHLDDLVDFLSIAMLIIKPKSRFPARKCWEEALKLSHGHCVTPTQASYGTGYLEKGALSPKHANTVESDQGVS